MKRFYPALRRLQSTVTILAMALYWSTGCTYVPVAPGAVAPPTAIPTSAQPPSSGGRWTSQYPQEEALDFQRGAGVEAMKDRVRQNGGIAAVVFFNEALSGRLSDWRAVKRHVLEADVNSSDQGASNRRVRMYTERLWDDGNQAIQDQVAAGLETALVEMLLATGLTIRDKNLINRLASREVGNLDLAAAELEALSGAVELLFEVALMPKNTGEGYDIQIRVIRTGDAALLAHVRAAGMGDKTVQSYPQRGGYVSYLVESSTPVEERGRRALDRALMDVADRY